MFGLSGKEIEVVSYLELNEKSFFTRKDIKHFFKNYSELTVYIHRLKKKGRIMRINKSKYYLVPIKAFKGHWSENPFIIVDEIFDGKNYYIGGYSAAHYWGFIEQIPTKTEVYCTNKQGAKEFFNQKIVFKRIRKISDFVRQSSKTYEFNIMSKEGVKEWMKSRK